MIRLRYNDFEWPHEFVANTRPPELNLYDPIIQILEKARYNARNHYALLMNKVYQFEKAISQPPYLNNKAKQRELAEKLLGWIDQMWTKSKTHYMPHRVSKLIWMYYTTNNE